MPIRIVLVDDHPTTRRGVAGLLGRDPELLVVGEASSGGEALSVVGLHRPDLVILDRHLPDADGLEVARRLLQSLPTVKVLFFSADGDLEGVNAALRAGAVGYVLKTGGDEELRQAIRFVTSGRLFVGPEVNACLLERYRQILTGQEAGPEHRLTGREREFLRLVAEGLRSKEIADRLQITPKSADTYRSRLMKKLGCGSTAELVRFALREGLASQARPPAAQPSGWAAFLGPSPPACQQAL